MSRRIEIELTSTRNDASFTWRAAGARQPKGVVPAAKLPSGAGVGDRFRVELETGLDGSAITQVIPERETRKSDDRLELIDRDLPADALVTSKLHKKSSRRRGDRDKTRGRDTRSRRRDDRSGDHKTAERPPRTKKTPPKPQAPRLRPKRTHRLAYLDTLPDEQRPVAEKLLEGGMPSLRKAIDEDNAKHRAQGQPEVPEDRLTAMADSILPRLADAEWHDRAEAALASVDEVDLRDLRSVVVAADDHARTDETRALASELRTRLAERLERAQSEWLDDLKTALDEKRVARVLNLSSRPPKAGSPIPVDLTRRMVAATNEALSPESASGRWVTLLDALAHSPIAKQVEPVGAPSNPSDELIAKVKKLSSRLPTVAAVFSRSAGKATPPPETTGSEAPR